MSPDHAAELALLEVSRWQREALAYKEPKMTMIYFTQFMRPNGAKQIVKIDRPDHIAKAADFILLNEFRFECEELSNGEVSLTISDDWGDYAFKLCPNGPQVPTSVDELITEFNVAAALKARAINKKS